MSTQIQQQQVQGLVNAVASLSTVSGNLDTTGANLAFDLLTTGISLTNSIALTGAAIAVINKALSGNTVQNENAIAATGSYLDGQVQLYSGRIASTGATNALAISAEQTARRAGEATLSGDITTTGTILSGNLDYTSGKVDEVSGNLDYTSGKLDTVSGDLTTNLALTGSSLSGRLGGNSNMASSLGSGAVPADQLYGEVSIASTGTCSTKILQWMGDVPSASTIPLYLGGVGGEDAQMPNNSQWLVKMHVNAKSIEAGDVRAGHLGYYALETGFIIDNEQDGSPKIQLTGINGNSGFALSGIHYNTIIDASGTTPRNLRVSGVNGYTGVVRFHATAYVSEMLT